MAWFVRFAHMHGQPITIGSFTANVDENGRLIESLPEDVADRCRMLPDVFRFVPDEQQAAPAAPAAAAVVAEPVVKPAQDEQQAAPAAPAAAAVVAEPVVKPAQLPQVPQDVMTAVLEASPSPPPAPSAPPVPTNPVSLGLGRGRKKK